MASLKAGVVLMDPPWRFDFHSAAGYGKSGPYHRMSIDELAALPLLDAMADNAALFLWVIDPQLPLAFELVARWNEREADEHRRLRYATVGFYWVKRTRTGLPHYGTGYWTRANPEQCLLFVRGKPRRRSGGVPRLIETVIGQHSEKPVAVHERIEQLLNGPYLEVFARRGPGYGRPGWAYIGDGVDGRDISDAMGDLIAHGLPELAAPTDPEQYGQVALF